MGKFLKGHKTNVGKKKNPHTQETKRKIGDRSIGRFWSDETREKMKKRIPWNKGKKGLQKHTEEWKRENSNRMKGNKHTLGRPSPLKGKPRLNMRGPNNKCWKGGPNAELRQIRNSIEYKLWRDAVFQRDKFTCIWCGQVGGKLNADHIKRFRDYPELRFAIDNGRTLCVPCHRTTDTWGTRGLKFKIN
jgi:hypothetical protein